MRPVRPMRVGWRTTVGNVQSPLQARYCECPVFALNNGKVETPAQAAGRRYEEKALPFLTQWARKNHYEPKNKPWIEYFDVTDRRVWCQPDFIAIGQDTDNLIIVEIKVRHTRDAFMQLRRYKSVIAELHPNHHISCLELCKNFDISEFNTTLLPEIRPHSLPHAAVLFDPREWTNQIN